MAFERQRITLATPTRTTRPSRPMPRSAAMVRAQTRSQVQRRGRVIQNSSLPPVTWRRTGDGTRKEEPRGIFDQITDVVTGVPRGLIGFGVDVGTDLISPIRATADVVGGHGLRSFGDYMPATTGTVNSIANSGKRFTATVLPTVGNRQGWEDYGDAWREGNIVDALVEDAGNIALVGGAAGRALGSTSKVVSGLTKEQAGVMAGRRLRSTGAMVAEDLADATVVRAPPTPLAEVANLTRLRPPSTRYTVTTPGRGLAGLAERAGNEGLAKGLGRAGDITRTVTRFGERAGNVPAAPYSYAGKGIKRVAEAAGYKPGSIVEGLTRRSATARGLLFPGTKVGRTLGAITAGVERSATDAARFVLEGARIAKEQGVDEAQGRAVGMSLDVPGFLQNVRTLDDTELGNLLDRMYPDVPKSERPTVEDAKAAWAYADRKMPADKLKVMDQVRDRLRTVSEVRTDAMVGDPNDPTTGLHPEQLGDDLRGTVVNRERGVEERLRDIAQRTWETGENAAFRQERIAAATTAVANELPSPQHGAAVRDLNRAIDEYVKLAEDGPSPALERAAKELDRLTQRSEEIRQQVEQAEGRVGTAQAFTRASGDVEQGAPRSFSQTPAEYAVRQAEAKMEGSLADLAALNEKYGQPNAPRPEVNAPGKAEPQMVRARAKEIGDEQARQVFGEIEQMTEGNRPKLSEKGSAEREWFEELPKSVQNRLLREKWVRGVKQAGSSADEVAGSISRTVGGDARDVHTQMGRYVETVQRYWDAKSGKGDAVIEQVAADLGMGRDQVSAALRGKISDYGDLFVADANDLIDELRGDYGNLQPDEAALFHDLAGRMLDDPTTTLDDFGELLQSFFPGSDITGQEGVLARLDQADIREVIDWMRGGAPPQFPERLRAKMVERGPAQYRQQGRLTGDVQGAQALARENASGQRGARRVVDSVKRAEDAALNRAERKLAEAAERVKRESEGVDRRDQKKPSDPWSRRTGTTSTGETTNPLSPAERLQARAAVERDRAARLRARANRLREAVDNADEKVASIETELGRSLQDRVVEDLNRPAVVRWRSIVDKSAPTLGGIVGEGEAMTLTGLTRRLSGKYGIFHDVLSILDGMRQQMNQGRNLGAVQGSAAPMLDLPASEIGRVVDEVLRTKRIELEIDERIQLDDAVGKGNLLEEMAVVMGDNATGGLRLNAPHRVAEVINRSTWHMPDDAKTRLDAAVSAYSKRRAATLARVYDKWAEAMPAKWRTVSQLNRRAIGALMEMAEEANLADPGSGDIWLTMAEETGNTLAELVESGINPVHLTGGREALPIGSLSTAKGGNLGKTKTRSERRRRSGLRQLSLDAYARVEAAEAATLIRNRRNDIIAERLGSRADQVPEIANGMREWSDQHSGQQMPAIDVGKLAKEAGWVPMETGAAVGPQTILVPTAVKDHLSTADINIPGWKALKRGNQMWKTWVLPFSTKWMTGNVFGNVIQAAVHGGVGPVELARQMVRISKHEGGVMELWRRSGVPDWAPNEIAEHGLTHSEFQIMAGDEGATPGPVGRAAAWSYKLNSTVDNMTRSAVYLAKLMDGVPTDKALQSTLRALGDFTNLSSVERRVIREVLPFYSWMRHSISATLRLPITSPARAAMLLNLSQLYSDPEMTSELMELIGSKVPTGGPGKFWDFGSISPLSEVGSGGLPLDPINLAGSVSPVIKIGTFATTGFDISRMDQAKRPPGTASKGVFGNEEATSPLRRAFSNPLNALGELGYYATQQSAAPIRAARDLVLGDEARYATGYSIKNLKDKNKANRLAVIARGLNLPAPYQIDLERQKR
jgi:hypothetical protein